MIDNKPLITGVRKVGIVDWSVVQPQETEALKDAKVKKVFIH
jgi:hypothetical protein